MKVHVSNSIISGPFKCDNCQKWYKLKEFANSHEDTY